MGLPATFVHIQAQGCLGDRKQTLPAQKIRICDTLCALIVGKIIIHEIIIRDTLIMLVKRLLGKFHST